MARECASWQKTWNSHEIKIECWKEEDLHATCGYTLTIDDQIVDEAVKQQKTWTDQEADSALLRGRLSGIGAPTGTGICPQDGCRHENPRAALFCGLCGQSLGESVLVIARIKIGILGARCTLTVAEECVLDAKMKLR
jgi:hypothetical protein